MLRVAKSKLVAGEVASRVVVTGTSPELLKEHPFAIDDHQLEHPGLMMSTDIQSANYDMASLDMLDTEPFTFDEFVSYENLTTKPLQLLTSHRQKQSPPLSPPNSIPEMLSPVSMSEVESGYESVGSPISEPEPILTKNSALFGPITDLFPDLI